MKERITKFIYCSYSPYVVLLVALILITIKMDTYIGDVTILRPIYIQQSLKEVLVDNYTAWGSPSIVNVVLYVLVLLPPYVFKICNILVILLAAVSISKITNYSNDKNINWMIVLFVILYPLLQMNTAGWVVTSVVYMFPLAFGLYSLVAIQKTIRKEKVTYVTSIIALCIGSGSPQMSCILAGIYIVFSIYSILLKNINKFFIVQSIIPVMFVVYHLTAPGNLNRSISETITWFPDFNMISTINKIKLGFTNTLANFISTPNIFFTVFCILLFLGVYLKYKDNLYRIVAFIPLAATLMFGLFNDVFYHIFPRMVGLMNVNDYDFIQITTYTFISKIHYIPIIMGVIIIGCILLAIYLIFENTLMSILINIVFLAGFASRMIMSFSPTLYVSNTRTFIFMYFSIIVCGVFIFNKITENMDHITQSKLLSCLGFVTVLYYIELFIQI